jgi:hypothetical protein
VHTVYIRDVSVSTSSRRFAHTPVRTLCAWGIVQGLYSLGVPPWVLAQPVHLTDEESDQMPFVSADGQVCEWKISRREVAQFLALAAQGPDYLGQSVALSGAGVGA